MLLGKSSFTALVNFKSTPNKCHRFIDVANETMCRPIRTLTEAKGCDASLHNLASFGGAGGQHACEIARKLGISRVLIHKYSSVLSAYGMALADVVHEERSSCALLYTPENFSTLSKELDRLQKKSVKALLQQRNHSERITSERYLNMRFHGSDTSMMIQETNGMDGFLETFKRAQQEQFGFLPAGRDVIVDDLRVRSIGSSGVDVESPWKEELDTVSHFTLSTTPETKSRALYFKETGWTQAPIYELGDLKPGSCIAGPALIMDSSQTIVVAPKSSATILSNNVIIDVEVLKKETITITHVDPIQLSIFGHRFMGVAEQMGRALQKTSVSTNIKERLDFSCTVFAADGGLVANAPHVPAMVSSIPIRNNLLIHILITLDHRLVVWLLRLSGKLIIGKMIFTRVISFYQIHPVRRLLFNFYKTSKTNVFFSS